MLLPWLLNNDLQTMSYLCNTYINTRMIFLRTYLLVIFILFSEILFAQEGFKIAIDGGGDDVGQSIDIFPNGDIIVGGVTESFGFGGEDWLISRFSTNGALLWSKAIGTSFRDNNVYDVKALSSGNIFVLGHTQQNNPSGQSVYAMLNPSGNIMWSRSFASESSSVIEMSDGDIVIVGQTASFGEGLRDGIITRVSATGETLWSKSLGTGAKEGFNDVLAISDERILVVGYKRITDNPFNCWLIEYSDTGEIMAEYSLSSANIQSDFSSVNR